MPRFMIKNQALKALKSTSQAPAPAPPAREPEPAAEKLPGALEVGAVLHGAVCCVFLFAVPGFASFLGDFVRPLTLLR